MVEIQSTSLAKDVPWPDTGQMDITSTIRAHKWVVVLAVWFACVVALVSAWFVCRSTDGAASLPHWFVWMAAQTGSVLYIDPALKERVQISRLLVIVTALALGAVGLVERRRLARALSELWNYESYPVNLAVFRVVVFWQIYKICDFPFIQRLAMLPAGLQYPPQTGLLGAWARWPLHTLSPDAIGVLGVAMKYAAITAAIGLFSRTSAGVVCFVFLVAWSRLQWYGKVDHLHHLLWFALLLALSPSGDALSVDGLIRRVRRGSRGGTASFEKARRYGAPLAISMVLMGVIYLFPGLWKICRSGLDWALSDSPRQMMQLEWKFYGDWLPVFRFDQHPLLYKTAAMGTMLFELSFLFLLLGRRARYVAAVLGVGFHLMTYYVLNIGFESLRDCYVIFLNWRGLLDWVERRVSRALLLRALPARALARREATDNAGVVRGRVPMVLGVVGLVLIVGNIWVGAIRAMDGWPLACYPPFDGLSEPSYRTIRIVVTLDDGSNRTIVADDYRTTFRNRWNNLLQQILDNPSEGTRRRQLTLVWQVLATKQDWVARAQKVRFITVRSFVDPSLWKQEPDDEQLLYEAPVERTVRTEAQLRPLRY